MRCMAMRVLFFLMAMFLLSCKKDNSSSSTSVVGEWELLRVVGSRPLITYPSGNGNVLKFTNTNYQAFESGQLTKSGTYSIIEDGSVEASVCLVVPQDKYRQRLIFDNDYGAPKKFIQITNDTLSVLSGCFAIDGGSNTEYVRKR